MKILYMVVAGLALACGFERFVSDINGQFHLPTDIFKWVLFVIFVTTVARFVHGAMRHFDYFYIEKPQDINWRRQPLWDLLFLGLEAFVFFVLAFSLDDLSRFITFYFVLLLVDTIWLFGVFITHLKRLFIGTPAHWIIANTIVLISTGIPWIWYHDVQTQPLWFLLLFIAMIIIHSVMDYVWNWDFYFGESPRVQSEYKGTIASDVSTDKSQIISPDVVFIAGAYSGRDFNEIDENIRLAESYSIKLWNLGYKVFCPHLNTSHFEAKAKVGENVYKEFDMRMLSSCDAVFALPNWQNSKGAKAEIEEANRLGKPVFYSLGELLDKSKSNH
ncbi:DUF4406 domain-containing protein [Chloroflexota bacterium]